MKYATVQVVIDIRIRRECLVPSFLHHINTKRKKKIQGLIWTYPSLTSFATLKQPTNFLMMQIYATARNGKRMLNFKHRGSWLLKLLVGVGSMISAGLLFQIQLSTSKSACGGS